MSSCYPPNSELQSAGKFIPPRVVDWKTVQWPKNDHFHVASMGVDDSLLQRSWGLILQNTIRRIVVCIHQHFIRQVISFRDLHQGSAASEGGLKVTITEDGGGSLGGEPVFYLDEWCNLYSRIFENIARERAKAASGILMALYRSEAANFVSQHVIESISCVPPGEPFLQLLVAASENFATFLKFMSKLFISMDCQRSFSVHESRPPMRNFGICIFEEQVWQSPDSRARLTSDLIELYRRIRRELAPADIKLYQSVMDSVFEFMIDYRDAFEDYCGDVIDETSAYYTNLLHLFKFGTMPIPEYENYVPQQYKGRVNMNLIEYVDVASEIREREKWIHGEIHERNSKQIEAKLLRILVHCAVGTIYTEESVITLLRSRNVESMRKCYELFHNNNNANQMFAKCFEAFVTEECSSVIANANDKITKDRVKICNKLKIIDTDPKAVMYWEAHELAKSPVIKLLMEKHDEHLELLSTLFQKDHIISASLKKAYEKVLCRKIGEPPLEHHQHSLLVMYVDRVLRRKEETGDPLDEKRYERVLDSVCLYFQYFREKDIFMSKHRDLLARRILGQGPGSSILSNAHLESYFLTNLRSKVGINFVQHAEGMIQDFHDNNRDIDAFSKWALASRDAVAEYDAASRQAATEACPMLDFSVASIPVGNTTVNILNASNWPKEDLMAKGNLRIHPALGSVCKSYEMFYREKEGKKRIEWAHRSGQAIIIFRPAAASEYRITANDQQATVLAMFVSLTATVKVQDIMKFLCPGGLADHETQEIETFGLRVIKSLLVKPNNPLTYDSHDGDVQDEELLLKSLRVNKEFESKEYSITLPMPKVEANATQEKVSGVREDAIKGAAVRVMKQRKTLSRRELINDVMAMCKDFSPSRRTIKKLIDWCITRDYMKQDDDDAEMITYIG